MLPVDEVVTFPVHIGYHPEKLVLGSLNGDGLKGKHIGKVGLL